VYAIIFLKHMVERVMMIAKSIIATTDKGSLVAGRTTSGSPTYDGMLMKLAENGSILWARTYGGTGYDEFLKVRETSDGGFIALGTTASYTSDRQIWLVKTDLNGSVTWSKYISMGAARQNRKTSSHYKMEDTQ
jgi:hypothetical protein